MACRREKNGPRSLKVRKKENSWKIREKFISKKMYTIITYLKK